MLHLDTHSNHANRQGQSPARLKSHFDDSRPRVRELPIQGLLALDAMEQAALDRYDQGRGLGERPRCDCDADRRRTKRQSYPCARPIRNVVDRRLNRNVSTDMKRQGVDGNDEGPEAVRIDDFRSDFRPELCISKSPLLGLPDCTGRRTAGVITRSTLPAWRCWRRIGLRPPTHLARGRMRECHPARVHTYVLVMATRIMKAETACHCGWSGTLTPF